MTTPITPLVPLVTARDLATRCRVETHDEDEALTEIVAVAEARVRLHLSTPIEATEKVMIDEAWDEEVYIPLTTLLLPYYPVDIKEEIEITDFDGNVVDPTTYYLPDPINEGRILARRGNAFGGPGPFTIRATVGLALDPYYEERIKPVLRGAVLDTAAAIYYQRNPSATTESESGVSATWDGEGIPKRAMSALNQLRRTVGPI